MAWRRVKRPTPAPATRPDTQNVLARLDAAIDRLEGAYQQLDDLAPLLERYAAALQQQRQREGRW